jgi:hypothetical protein
MYNYPDLHKVPQIFKAINAFKKMPNNLIAELMEKQYREEVLVHFGLTESEVTDFLSRNMWAGLDLDKHTLDLRKRAFKYRTKLENKIKKLLLSCKTEEERLECLRESDCANCNAYGRAMWQRFYDKSFYEFAQWHIEQGGWQSDFQESNFNDFAESWAEDWICNWLNREIINIEEPPIEEETQIDYLNSNSQGLKGSREQTTQRSSETLQIFHIPPQARLALYNDLKEYMECDEAGEAPELRALIFDHLKPFKPLVVSCGVEEFGQTFFETGAAPFGAATLLSKQIPLFFRRNNGKEIVDFKPSHLVKQLRKGKQ